MYFEKANWLVGSWSFGGGCVQVRNKLM